MSISDRSWTVGTVISAATLALAIMGVAVMLGVQMQRISTLERDVVEVEKRAVERLLESRRQLNRIEGKLDELTKHLIERSWPNP